jgi:hypothetical protein
VDDARRQRRPDDLDARRRVDRRASRDQRADRQPERAEDAAQVARDAAARGEVTRIDADDHGGGRYRGACADPWPRAP